MFIYSNRRSILLYRLIIYSKWLLYYSNSGQYMQMTTRAEKENHESCSLLNTIWIVKTMKGDSTSFTLDFVSIQIQDGGIKWLTYHLYAYHMFRNLLQCSSWMFWFHAYLLFSYVVSIGSSATVGWFWTITITKLV